MGGRLQPGATGSDGRRSPLRRAPTRAQLGAVYRRLLALHGPQQWWPHESAGEETVLEICLGAILTQNTSWRGAAAALGKLLGRPVARLRLADAPALADELRAAVGAG